MIEPTEPNTKSEQSEAQPTADWSEPPTERPTPLAATPPGYVLGHELGRGGMGVVYLAQQIALHRTVALKLILAGAHVSETARRRFRSEATLSARFNHPNIVQVFETGEVDDLPFLALEYCSGGSLHQKLQGTPLNPSEAAHIAETLAHAMQHAHEHGVLHRDLKPQNVIFSRDGQPKLMDFGLAKSLDDEDMHTNTGAILGTPSYMAPEQAQGQTRALNATTDVYGLGAILYEMLTGRPPFRAATGLDTLMQVMENDPVPPRQLQPNIPRDLETICLKCLAKDSRSRYPTAREFAEDLRRFQAGEPILARPLGVVGRLNRWTKRHPALATLLVTLLSVLLVFSGQAFRSLQSREHQLRAFSLRKNASDARHVASTVLLRLQRVAQTVEQAAQSPEFLAILQSRNRDQLRAFCQEIEARGEIATALAGSQVDPVASWMVLDPQGEILAVSHDEGLKEPAVPGRDYFHGALAARLAAGKPVVHISRSYRSRNQGLNKFALSMVVEQEQKPLGVLVVTLVTGSTLGSRLEDSDQAVVLALPVDTTPLEGPIPEQRPTAEYVLVVHPAYEARQEPVRISGQALPEFPLDLAREFESNSVELLRSTDDYQDPAGQFSQSHEGPFWAGFAQVGHSEMIVIVQESQARAITAERELLLQLSFWTGGTALLGLSLSGAVLLRKRPRSSGTIQAT